MIKALSISLLNQVLGSATNFIIVLYLVRAMDKVDFGLYSFGFALILMVAGLTVSFIAVHFVVNLPDQPDDKRADYAIHYTVAVALLGLTVIILSISANFISTLNRIGDGHFAILALPVAAASAFYALRDFLVRVAYSERRELVVLFSSIAVAGGLGLWYLGLYLVGVAPTSRHALIAYAAGQATGCLAALGMLRLPWRHLHWRGVCRAFRDAWPGGRWNVLTNMVYTLRTQAHNFVVGPLLGAAALADVNAARVLVTPAVMALPPLTQLLMPRLAERRTQGTSSLSRGVLLMIGGLAAFALCYAVALMAVLPWVLPLVLGDTYRHVGGLVLGWCVVALLLTLRSGLTIVLQVLRAFSDLLFANSAAAIVAVLLAVLLSKLWGASGAIVAFAAAEALLCIEMVFVLRARTVSQLV